MNTQTLRSAEPTHWRFRSAVRSRIQYRARASIERAGPSHGALSRDTARVVAKNLTADAKFNYCRKRFRNVQTCAHQYMICATRVASNVPTEQVLCDSNADRAQGCAKNAGTVHKQDSVPGPAATRVAHCDWRDASLRKIKRSGAKY